MVTKEQQKYLNYAFYAALAMSGITLVFVFGFGNLTLGLLGTAELILFPILGFMVKRGNFKASFALLSLFVVDRVAFVVNWWSQLFTPTIGLIPSRLIVAVLQSWVLWICFYGAFKVLKKGSKK